VIFAAVAETRSTAPALYDELYRESSFEAPPTVAATLDRVVAAAEPFRRTGRWLDIGFGEGGLLSAAAARGWSCYGTEVSGVALEHGRYRGWSVSRDADGDDRFAPASFDVVTMIELLEHVSSPRAFLRRAARWLRPGGLLYLTTPNARSVNRWLLGPAWSIFRPPDHRTIWTAEALVRVLGEHGLVVDEVRTEGWNPSDVLSRIRSFVGPAVEANRNRTAVALNDYLSRSRSRRSVKAGVNAALNAARLGDSLKVRAVRAASTT
jgi:SAM-dependent methyltransferase